MYRVAWGICGRFVHSLPIISGTIWNIWKISKPSLQMQSALSPPVSIFRSDAYKGVKML